VVRVAPRRPLCRPFDLVTLLSSSSASIRVALPSVYAAALDCQERGWSVIPLIGGSDADLGKRAALPWTPYQCRTASSEELREWFAHPKRTAYGVVCGTVSRLIVIDLDDEAVEASFVAMYSQARATFRVQSGLRGGVEAAQRGGLSADIRRLDA
jgi:hypothetical protein